METHRYGPREKKERLKPTFKKVSNLYEQVKERVIFLRDCDKEAFQKETGKHYRVLTKEEFSTHFKVKTHEIEQCFQRLNKEGILAHPKRNHVHDTKREPYGYGDESGWAADLYYYMDEDDKWHRAVWDENKKIIEKMLGQGYDINKKSGGKSTFNSVKWGQNIKMLQYLVSLGARPDEEDLIDYISEEKQFLYLLQQTDNTGLENVLFKAAELGLESAAKALLAKKAEVNAQDAKGNTALILAVREGHTGIAEMLLLNKAKISIKDQEGKTAYDYAKETKRKEVLSLFLEFEKKLNKEQAKDMKKRRLRLLY